MMDAMHDNMPGRMPMKPNTLRCTPMHRMIALAGTALLAACTSQPRDEARRMDNGITDARPKDKAVEPARIGKTDVILEKPVSPPVTSKPSSMAAGHPSTPSSTTRGCYLKVDGIVRVDGPCLVFPMGKDEYTLNTWTNGKPKNSHFAMVSANPDGSGTATWNADPDDDRALDPLGTVQKDGDCWVNNRARICVR